MSANKHSRQAYAHLASVSVLPGEKELVIAAAQVEATLAVAEEIRQLRNTGLPKK
ncbi:hypothetical protein [Gordonia sp. NPDC003422]